MSVVTASNFVATLCLNLGKKMCRRRWHGNLTPPHVLTPPCAWILSLFSWFWQNVSRVAEILHHPEERASLQPNTRSPSPFQMWTFSTDNSERERQRGRKQRLQAVLSRALFFHGQPVCVFFKISLSLFECDLWCGQRCVWPPTPLALLPMQHP